MDVINSTNMDIEDKFVEYFESTVKSIKFGQQNLNL